MTTNADLAHVSSTNTSRTTTVFISWPSAPLTYSLVLKSLENLTRKHALNFHRIDSLDNWDGASHLLQWSTYDVMDHGLQRAQQKQTLASSYTIRKALIRKNYLSQAAKFFVAKHENSILRKCIPKTWHISLSFADELDDMWNDELWEMTELMHESNNSRWWILKPAMTDGGKGLYLFNSRESLQALFEKFEMPDSEETEYDPQDSLDTWVSSMRDFVIQEYLDEPLLLAPGALPPGSNNGIEAPLDLTGHKFHLRVYCVASGALSVYAFSRVLTLFSTVPYQSPTVDESRINLAAHITNTSSQPQYGESAVRLLSELAGCQLVSSQAPYSVESNCAFTSEDIEVIMKGICDILAETFQATLELPAYFQPSPNSFELYGVDFLLTRSKALDEPKFHLSLLEINSEPAIEMTGPRLLWILEELFVAIGEACVRPFVDSETLQQDWKVGETKWGLRKCFENEVRAQSLHN